MLILEEDGNISGFVGKCSEYIELRDQQKREQLLNDREQKREEKKEGKAFPSLPSQQVDLSATPSKGSNAALNACSSAPRKRTWKEQKEFESLENEILELEEKKSALETEMSSGAKIDYESINRQYNDLTAELEKKYERWEELGLLS